MATEDGHRGPGPGPGPGPRAAAGGGGGVEWGGWVKKQTKKIMCAQQSQKSESYTARLPFGSTKKT